MARGGVVMSPGADAPIRFHNTCITYSVQQERGRESACVHVFFFTIVFFLAKKVEAGGIFFVGGADTAIFFGIGVRSGLACAARFGLAACAFFSTTQHTLRQLHKM